MPSDSDMAVLRRRMAETARRCPDLPIIVLDYLLPRQRHVFVSNARNAVHLERMAEAGEVGVLGELTPPGMLDGRPNPWVLHGVVAAVSRLGPSEWELRGTRHVRVLGPAFRGEDGLARVQAVEPVEDAAEEADVEAAGALVPLMEEWEQLVQGRHREHFPGQLRGILGDLGPMPPAEDAGDLALWAAALLNPMPALGLAEDVRSAVLKAGSVKARLEAVHRALRDSLESLRGGGVEEAQL